MNKSAPAAKARAVGVAEAKSLFEGLERASGVLLAVSGGPDSIALMWLVARWRAGRRNAPPVFAATVDHGLRREARAEAKAVARLAAQLNVPHRILRWTGSKPATGLQKAARDARYRLLAKEAARCGASHLVTAHTRDDQAETVLMRLARGSGLRGLAAMAAETPLDDIVLARPLLDVPKARLVATASKSNLPFADDPSNADPRFTRARWRQLMPELAREGLDAARLARFAWRMRRGNEALDAVAARALAALSGAGDPAAALVFSTASFFTLPEEIQVRVLRAAIDRLGREGPAELGKVENLLSEVTNAAMAGVAVRRTLAGALITADPDKMTVQPAPPRRKKALTKSRSTGAKRRISR